MSSGSTAMKVFGVIAVILLLMFLACAGGGFYLYYAGKDLIEAEQKQMEFAASWRAPAEDAAAEDLFPQTVGSFKLESHDENANVAAFDIEEDGWHGVYKSGAESIDVYVYPGFGNDAIVDRWRTRSMASIRTPTSGSTIASPSPSARPSRTATSGPVPAGCSSSSPKAIPTSTPSAWIT